MTGNTFFGLAGDMCALPFRDNCFDRAFSMTAIEFITDAAQAVNELNRVVKKGGTIVVSTLNSLSPWAERRKEMARKGHSLFRDIIFRSPDEIRRLLPEQNIIKTAIHFQKDDDVEKIPEIEEAGRNRHLETGAFLAAQWIK